jgi:hypothetical protein
MDFSDLLTAIAIILFVIIMLKDEDYNKVTKTRKYMLLPNEEKRKIRTKLNHNYYYKNGINFILPLIIFISFRERIGVKDSLIFAFSAELFMRFLTFLVKKKNN